MRELLVIVSLSGCYYNLKQPGTDHGAELSRTPDPPAACDGGHVLCVAGDSPEPEERGTADRPYHSVAAALAAAGQGDVLQVAQGTYPENLRLEALSVQLLGGFPGDTRYGTRDPAAHPTILQGVEEAAVVTLIESSAIVDGFTITGGAGHFDGDRWEGGGIYAEGGAPTISGNVIEGNDARHGPSDEVLSRGGGVAVSGGDAWIVGNVIRGNQAGRGAGVAASGPSLLISRNVIEDNAGDHDHGGGLFVSSPNVEISANRIARNEIGRDLGYGWGGGIFLHELGTYARLSKNVVSENYAPLLGSGVFVDNEAHAVLAHELYVGNACPQRGGAGLYVDGLDDTGTTGSFVEASQITVADHGCQNELGGNGVFVEGTSQVTITDSLFWGNGDDFFTALGSTIEARYTLAAEALPGAGNLSADPLLGPGYHPRSMAGRYDPDSAAWVSDAVHSPAIDAADPGARWDAEPAPNGHRANLGYDGDSPEASRSR